MQVECSSPLKDVDISPILRKLTVMASTPIVPKSEGDASSLSADRTILASGSPRYLVPKYKRRATDLIPAQLEFSQISTGFTMSSFVENVNREGSRDENDDELSDLREIAGVRHMEEDPKHKVEVDQSNILSDRMDDCTACCTPTGCGVDVFSWDDEKGSKSASVSAIRTPKLSRPLKKVHVVHSFSRDTIKRSNSETSEDEGNQRSQLMGQQDFTPLLRSASDLDYERHYEYISLLGHGAFGEVWLVRHHRNGKLFALKKSMRQFRGRRDRDSYLREIHCVARLAPHRNIVRYDRAWQDAGYFYIAMELCTGGTLSGLMGRERWIRLDYIRDLIYGCLCGLKHLHENDLLHLDLKPDNLFISEDGGIKIGDFGLCLPATALDSEEGDCAYLAPEILNQPATSAADIFSAGLILYQLLMGVAQLPGHGSEWQRLRSDLPLFEQPPPFRIVESQESSVWDELAQLSLSMLATRTFNRPTASQCLTTSCLRMK